jgi:hypothetical protein
MPSNRKPINRATRSRVTDEARAVFAEAVTLQGIYHNCISNNICRSTSLNQHCTECAKYLDLSRKLGSLLGIKPWETSPLNTNSADPPDYVLTNSLRCEPWRKAWAMRCEMQK